VQAGQRIFAGRQINSGDGWHVRGDRAPYRGAACIVIDRGGGLMLRAAD
jgi:allantoicase